MECAHRCPSTIPCAEVTPHAWLLRRASASTLGRSSLLPSQPDQSIVASGECAQFSRHVRPAVFRPDGRGDARMAGGDDDPASRSFFLRAQGLRRDQPSDARLQGVHQGRLQLATKSGVTSDLGAVPAPAMARSRARRLAGAGTRWCRLRDQHRLAVVGGRHRRCDISHGTPVLPGRRADRPGLDDEILTDPFHDVALYYRAPAAAAGSSSTPCSTCAGASESARVVGG